MKNIYLIGMVLIAVGFTACETATTQNNSANNTPTENTSTTKVSDETSTQRHIKIKSENSFDETYNALKKAIEANENLTVVAELDHQANAKKAEMELRPTKIIMFGNPKLGSPLMKENQEIGIDLPQKILVYEVENGDVYVVYNDPKVLAENHNIKGQDEVLEKISGALKSLAETATKKK